MKTINLKISRKVNSLIRKGHPWVFEDSIIKQSAEGEAGDIAVLYDDANRFLAVGLFDPHSPIRVKILQANKPVTIDEDFFRNKLIEGIGLRSSLFTSDTNGYRLIHGENDGLPGLTIDKYDKTLVIKVYTSVWFPYLNQLVKMLQSLIYTKNIVLRLSERVFSEQKNTSEFENGMILFGDKIDKPIIFSEHGLKFEADVIHGQKTGFFLDQRENRFLLEKLASKKKVLNVFSYNGGFSVYATRGGATSVTNIDISDKALESIPRNLNLNFNNCKTEHNYIKGDAFVELLKLRNSNKSFDIVIIDPPSFAKKEVEIKNAIGAYEKLTHLGLQLVNKGGILVQSSCSSRITANQFYGSVLKIVKNDGFLLKEIARTGHAIDHPIKFKEGEYLKSIFTRCYKK